MPETSSKATYIQSENSYNQREHFNAHPFIENLIWLTTDEAATFLRKSSHALRQMTYKGKIHPRKFGGRLYFKKAELNDLVDTSFT
ncbi:MAG TPA: helix-turn-helix domain-containing protein [Bacteriovoracaceae bacterium]|nr:helix-turn-helix domain-containing protein [Bacteriovoracaceae bacterium]